MCVTAESGECKAGGTGHLDHFWRKIIRKPKQFCVSGNAQLIGFRDDGQGFYVTVQGDDWAAAEARLDLELKCCACNLQKVSEGAA